VGVDYCHVYAGDDLLLYACGYVFFSYRDSDALRSERYSLSKMAIEHRLVGDNTTGLVEVIDAEPAEEKTPRRGSKAIAPKRDSKAIEHKQ
jgi:hypothetical protein